MKLWRTLLIAAAITASPVAAEVVISGPVGTETWTKANQPYRINGAITVTAGNTLTIEPGVNIFFEADARFIVQGAVQAVGTVNDSIVFSPDYVNTQTWGGLRMSGGQTNSFAYVRIEGGFAQGTSPDNFGGAIYAVDTGTHIDMQNSVIRGNRSASSGGAIHLASGATAVIANSTFESNLTTANHGGAIAVFDGSIDITNTTFFKNHTAHTGGAIYLARSSATLSNATLDSNTSNQDAAAIAVLESSTLDVANSIFQRGIAGQAGGAIRAAGGSTITLSSVQFYQNLAASYYGGGAIYIDNSTLTISNSPFTGNISTGTYGHGAAIRAASTAIRVDDSSFDANHATGTHGYGGAIYATNCDIVIRNTSITNNIANSTGGGLYLLNSATNAILDNVIITGNVTSSVNGGGIRAHNSSQVTVLNSIITHNISAENGGGLAVTSNANVRLVDVRVDSNRAAQHGGGVAVWSSGIVRLTNTSVDSNFAVADGGGVYVESARLDMLNSTITRNVASDGGGLRAKSTSSITLTNVTVTENVATSSGGAIRAFDSAVGMVNSILWNNIPQEVYTDNSAVNASYSILSLSDPGVVSGPGNIEGDPLFIDPSNLVFLPGPSSPAIDAGDPADVRDKDGSRIDIGRLPYRIAEVEGVLTQTTWTREDSPYRVIGTVTVPQDSVLLIEPGTDIFIAKSAQLIVYGALRANGAPGDSIRFLPWRANTWGSIRILSTDSSSISFARISRSRMPGSGTSARGGAIFLAPEGRLGLDNVVFSDNYSANDGGAIYASSGAVLTANNASFIHNAAQRGGAIYGMGSALLSFTNSRFVADSTYTWYGYGGAIGAEDVAHINLVSSVFDTNVTIGSSAAGGAVYVWGTGTLHIEGSLFTRNGAGSDNGGAIYVGGGTRTTIVRTEISRNFANYGTGIYMTSYGTRVNLINSLVTGHVGPFSSSGGIYIANFAELHSENSIIWNNHPLNVYNHLSQPVNVDLSYTIIGAANAWLELGPGNINADPIFNDPDNGDYTLTTLSPAIDAGDPNAPTDPDGTRLDIGPYPFNQSELRLELPTTTYPAYTVSAGDTVIIPIRAWLSGAMSIQFGIVVDSGALIAADSSSFIVNNALADLPEYHGFHQHSGDTVRVALAATGELNISDGVIMELVYIAARDLSPGSVVPLRWVRFPETNVNEKAVVTANGSIVIEQTPQDITYGDVSGDTHISAFDASLILQYVVRTLVTINELAADVSGDGTVSAYDAALVLHKVVNPSYIFPVLGGPLLKTSGGPRTLVWVRVEGGWELRTDALGPVGAEITLRLPKRTSITGPAMFASEWDGNLLRVAIAAVGGEPVLLRVPGDAAPVVVSATLNERETTVATPVEFSLAQNAPNPFNPSTVIRLGIETDGQVTLTLYDVNGRFVLTLVDGNLSAGYHEFVWDGTDSVGRAVASGLYVYRLTTADGTLMRRMSLIR